MFKVQDFLYLLAYLKGETVPYLDSNLKIQAEAERTTATSFFENVIDQICYSSDDYKRLRSFLIDWYAAHRTMTSTQRYARDVFSLPSDQLDELFRSFGYNYSSDLESFVSKANFFLDLVNLYKIKGTPQALIQVLNYYGITDVELFEFFVMKNNSGDIIFRPQKVDPYESGEKIIPVTDLLFDVITSDDPHWMMSKQDVENLLQTNKIGLPSKSPYFALRPRYRLFQLAIPLSVIQRFIQDEYYNWISSGTPPIQTLTISKLNYSASVLELYLANIYVFNTFYTRTTGSSDQNFLCYDGTNVMIADIEAEYNNLTGLPTSRDERDSNIIEYKDLFTRKMSTNFLDSYDKAGTILATLNSDLKASLDNLLLLGKGFDILKSLLRDLSSWIKSYVGPDYPDLATTVIGIEALEFLFDVIDFFKPYHARLSTIELLFLNDAPLLDSVRVDDFCRLDIYQYVIDFLTCNSVPCCADDSTACVLYSRETYDCGSYYDAGAACDKDNFTTDITQYVHENLVTIPDATCVTVQSGSYVPFAEDTSASIIFWQAGGWGNFDEGDYFDSPTCKDIVDIYVFESTATAEISFDTTSTFTYEIYYGGSIPNASIRVWNSSSIETSVLPWVISSGASWISANPPSGFSYGEKDTIDIIYDTSTVSVGTHNENIIISSINATNSPQTIPVTLVVRGYPEISISPSELTANCIETYDATSASFEIWNSGYETLNYNITTDSSNWISVVPDTGSSTGEHDTINVNYNTSGLAVGDHTGTITISDSSATNSPIDLVVRLTVEAGTPTIDLSTYNLSQTIDEGNDGTSHVFTIQNSALGTLNYTITTDSSSWLSIVPDTGSSTGEADTINVYYNTSGLAAGDHTGTITISDPLSSNSPQVINVSLRILSTAVSIATNVDETGITALAQYGFDAPDDSFEIWAEGNQLNYSISVNAQIPDSSSWITIIPDTGSSTGEHDTINVYYDTAELIVATHSGQIIITDTNASNSPYVIPVTLTVDGTATVEVSQVLAEVEASVDQKVAVSQMQLDVEFDEADELRVTQAQLDVEMTEVTGIKLVQAGIQVEGTVGDEIHVSQLYVQAEVD